MAQEAASSGGGAALLRGIYTLVLALLLPAALLRLAWLGLRNPGYLKRWRERLGCLEAAAPPTLLVHAVSVGEVLAAAPLLRRLMEKEGLSVVVSTTTPTGADTVRRVLGDSVRHVYFPYDLPFLVGRFLDRLRPGAVVIMETEIWPNFLSACGRRRIPVALVNARLSARSAAGYARFPALARAAMEALDLIAAQGEPDARRFVELGAVPDRVKVCGNLKFDVQLAASIVEQGAAQRRRFSVDRPVFMAASTHHGEEPMVLEAFRVVLEQEPRCLLVLAPRHPERAGAVEDLCRRAGLRTVRRTGGEASDPGTAQVFLLDTLGELPVFYAAADVAFVGGSLVPLGGHNLLEPASLGLPLLSGPHVFNFAEAAERLEAAGALAIVAHAKGLAGAVLELLRDANLRHARGEAARRVFRENRGSAEVVAGLLQPFLAPRAVGRAGAG